MTLDVALRDAGSRPTIFSGVTMRKSMDRARDRAITRLTGRKTAAGADAEGGRAATGGLSRWKKSRGKLKVVALLSDRSDLVTDATPTADVENPAPELPQIRAPRTNRGEGARRNRIVSTAI